jgi:hypothetical protein
MESELPAQEYYTYKLVLLPANCTAGFTYTHIQDGAVG